MWQMAGNNPSAAVAARPPNFGESGGAGAFNPGMQPPMPWQGQQHGFPVLGSEQQQQQQQQAVRPPPPPSWQGSDSDANSRVSHPPWKGPVELSGASPCFHFEKNGVCRALIA